MLDPLVATVGDPVVVPEYEAVGITKTHHPLPPEKVYAVPIFHGPKFALTPPPPPPPVKAVPFEPPPPPLYNPFPPPPDPPRGALENE